jgi:MFS family permease
MAEVKRESKIRDGRQNNVVWLGLTSLFSDISTEMLNPILPLFMFNVLGASGALIGLVEGIAKASEYILSIFSGWLSDRMQRRKPITVLGYLIATLMKAGYAFAFTWPQLLLARIVERSGKAIRNPPRDALLSESVSASKQRWGFSLHRILDTLGAIVGPFVTIAFLFFLGVNLQTLTQDPALLSSVARQIFLLALIPGFICVVIVAIFVVEAKNDGKKIRKYREEKLGALLKDMFNLSKYGQRYRKFLAASLILFLAMPSIAFLYLKASQTGFVIVDILLIAAMYNITYIIGAAFAGRMRLKDETALSACMLILALAFFLFVPVKGLVFLVPFALFGFVFGVFEVAMKTHISSIVPSKMLAGAFGAYNTLIGLAILASGIILGLLWDVNPEYMFTAAGILSLCAFAYFVKE